MIYVTLFCKPVGQYSHSRTFLHTGNSCDPTEENEDDVTMLDPTDHTAENSKTLYNEDSFKLDSIPLEEDDIVEDEKLEEAL
jgi:hypothetical protein